MSRKNHRDLPAIPEVSTPHEIEEEDDGATIESYAFTLDGVGFDEESGSIMHTPPQLLSPHRMTRRDEVELHRQTCRTLGIPCSEEMSIGSPRDSVPESLESATTTNDTKNIEMYDVPMKSPDGKKKNKSPDLGKKTRLITQAKIAEIASSYVNSVKGMAVSFLDKSKELYANSKQKFLTQDGMQVNGKKQTSFDLSKWYPTWFTEANPLIKLTASMTLFFFTLLIVVIVTVSKNSSQHVERSGTSLVDMDMTSLSSALNDTLVGTLDTTSTDRVAETSMPSYVPTYAPTITPTDEGVESNSCIDKLGSFQTSRGKYRTCSWLKAKHLARECGGLGVEPSELGLNCKLSCIQFNNCVSLAEVTDHPTAMPTIKPTNQKRKKNKNKSPQNTSTPKTTTTSTAVTVIDEGEIYFLDINHKLRPCSYLDIRNPHVQAKRRDENCPKVVVQEICPVSCLDYMEFTTVTTTTVSATTTSPSEFQEIKFLDTTGRERSCSWLDVKNSNQRTKRRDANCDKITVQMICSTSCEDYNSIPVSLDKQKRDGNSDIFEHVRSYELVLQDECYDRSGYFLNDVGHPVQCVWLNESSNDGEMRKSRNCGESQDATDLGVMCKSSCGLC